jgi:hypothetical protein
MKELKLPLFILRMLPLWSYECPFCHTQVNEKDRFCRKCGAKFTELQSRVPWVGWRDKKTLSDYIHKEVIPKVPKYWQDYLLQRYSIIFQDGFESGDLSAWSGVDVNSPNTVTVVSDVQHHGTYSCKMHGETDTWYARIYKSFPSTYPEIYYRIYFRLSDVANNIRIFNINGAGNEIFVVTWDGTQWIMSRKYPLTDDYVSDSLSVNTWYCLEMHFLKGTSGNYRVYKDGVQIYDWNGDTSGAPNVDEVQAGIYYASAVYDLWVDCVVVADTYIGPEVVPVAKAIAKADTGPSPRSKLGFNPTTLKL